MMKCMKEQEKVGGKMIETIKIDFSAEMENITWEKRESHKIVSTSKSSVVQKDSPHRLTEKKLLYQLTKENNDVSDTTKKSDSPTNTSKKSKKRLSNKEALDKAKPTYSDEEIQNITRSSISINSKISRIQDKKNEVLFSEGDEVFVKKYKKTGILLKKDKNNDWTVQIGIFKLSINQKDLKLIK